MLEAAPREYENIRITVPWGHIAGRWYGYRAHRLILALHGWLDNLGTWETLVPLLPLHIGVLCIDLPGHGRSSKYPKGMRYHTIDYVHIILRVMKEYKWQKVSLLAHSMGALVAFTYTSLYPHTVDMLIGIDVITSPLYSMEAEVDQMRIDAEKSLLEDERLDNLAFHEPPSYTYEQLERVLYEGSNRSVDMDKCKHLLNRNITKSKQFPDKYYFSRDGRLKYYKRIDGSAPLWLEMAKRITNVPYLVIKGSKNNLINERSTEVIEMLRQNNPHFEFYELDGTHHVHLNNATACASVISPFISAHRPAMPETWSVDDDETSIKSKKNRSRNKNAAKSRFGWLSSKL